MLTSSRRVVRTMCPMNCHPTLCGMLVEVEDDRVLGVRGDPDNPDSQGFLCISGQASREIVGNPLRLLHPLVRQRRGDTWRTATWDEALDRITSGMGTVGREAVAAWSGHGVFANNYGTRVNSHLLRLFANLYGCQWWSPAIICWGLGGFGLGLTGVMETNTKEDMSAHSRLIMLWGANLASQPNTARHVAAARRRGARVITIDVRQTEAAAQSDEVILVRPGTDAALALGMMHVIVAEDLIDREEDVVTSPEHETRRLMLAVVGRDLPEAGDMGAVVQEEPALGVEVAGAGQPLPVEVPRLPGVQGSQPLRDPADVLIARASKVSHSGIAARFSGVGSSQ